MNFRLLIRAFLKAAGAVIGACIAFSAFIAIISFAGVQMTNGFEYLGVPLIASYFLSMGVVVVAIIIVSFTIQNYKHAKWDEELKQRRKQREQQR